MRGSSPGRTQAAYKDSCIRLTSWDLLCLSLISSRALVWVCSDHCLSNQQSNQSITACQGLLRLYWPTFPQSTHQLAGRKKHEDGRKEKNLSWK